MESHMGLTPSDARAALDLVEGTNADLADRLVTPWWYHPGIGLAEAALVVSVTLPDHLWPVRLVLALAGAVAIGALAGAWSRATGLRAWSPRYNALARAWVVSLTLLLVAAFAVALLADRPAVTAAMAAVAFVGTVVVGRRGDAALRRRLRGPLHGAGGR